MIQKAMRAMVCAILCCLPIVAVAHSGATGIVKQRMDGMKDIGFSLKEIVAIARGQQPFDPAVVKAAADRIASHADEIPDLFPDGSLHKPSEATQTIWQDWTQFTKLATDLKSAATSLEAKADTLGGADDLNAFIPAIGQTCKSCHEAFRVKK